jgi:hypothetical protein
MIWVVLLLPLVLGCNSEAGEKRVVALEAQLTLLSTAVDSLERQVYLLAATVDSLSKPRRIPSGLQRLQYKGATNLDSVETVGVDSCEGRFIGSYPTDQGVVAEFAYWISLSNHTEDTSSVRYAFLFADQQGAVVAASPFERAELRGAESELFWKMTNLTVRFPNINALSSVRQVLVQITGH